MGPPEKAPPQGTHETWAAVGRVPERSKTSSLGAAREAIEGLGRNGLGLYGGSVGLPRV